MHFADHLVRDGVSGGEAAARALLAAVFEQLRYEPDFRYDEKIVVRVYANLRGFNSTYFGLGITGGGDAVTDFVTGFNKYNECCDFIDAGEGGR